MSQPESLTLLTPAEASEIVRLSARTHALSDLVAWIDAQARTLTSDPAASPEREVP